MIIWHSMHQYAIIAIVSHCSLGHEALFPPKAKHWNIGMRKFAALRWWSCQSSTSCTSRLAVEVLPKMMTMWGWNLYLVGALEPWNFMIFHIGNNHPNWLSYFSEGLKPPTRYVSEFLCGNYHLKWWNFVLTHQKNISKRAGSCGWSLPLWPFDIL